MITYSDELGSTQKPGIVIVLLSFDFFVGEMEQSLENSWQYYVVENFYIYQKSDFVKRVIKFIIKLFKSKSQLRTSIFSNERVNWNLEM